VRTLLPATLSKSQSATHNNKRTQLARHYQKKNVVSYLAVSWYEMKHWLSSTWKQWWQWWLQVTRLHWSPLVHHLAGLHIQTLLWDLKHGNLRPTCIQVSLILLCSHKAQYITQLSTVHLLHKVFHRGSSNTYYSHYSKDSECTKPLLRQLVKFHLTFTHNSNSVDLIWILSWSEVIPERKPENISSWIRVHGTNLLILGN
jgi:hypothetical protein